MENSENEANPNRKKRKRSDAVEINSVGELIFFDYRKNKFGYIEKIRNGTPYQPEKLRIYLTDISSEREIKDGNEVFFKLIKIGNSYRAKEVMLLYDALNIEFLSTNNYLLSDYIFTEALLRIQFNNGLKMTRIQENSLAERLMQIQSLKSWEIIAKYFRIESTDLFVKEVILPLNDREKIKFLNTSFHNTLANHIIKNWKSNEIEHIVKLFKVLSEHDSFDSNVLYSLVELAKALTRNLDDAWNLFMTNDVHFKCLVLQHFNFNSDLSIERFKIIRKKISEQDLDIENFRSKLERDLNSISLSHLIELLNCTEIKDLLPDNEKLISFLSARNGTYLDCYNLMSSLYIKNNPEKILPVVNTWLKNYQTSEILYLFERTNLELPSAEILLSHLSAPMKISYDLVAKVISVLERADHTELERYFIKRITEDKIIRNQSRIFKIALKTQSIDLIKMVFKQVDFIGVKEFLEFVETHGKIIIDKNIGEDNINLQSFIRLYWEDIFSNECVSFLIGKSGLFQLFTTKLLIRNYNKSKNLSVLISRINSFEWTTLSALILVKIIKQNNLNESIVLKILGETISEHFNELADKNVDKKEFENRFELSGILPVCNGRKKYNIDPIIDKGGFRGWISKSPNISISAREIMPCYCEGQPWKEEPIVNIGTGKPTNSKYKFYWCKGSYCAARNDIPDINLKPFNEWTLNEISIILDIKIETVLMSKLAGWVNKYQAIFDRLSCRECKSILRPVLQYSKYLGISSVPLFHCLNQNCSQNTKSIRFTHCLNGKCESHLISAPLDSRDCQPCHFEDKYNWGVTCNYCGSPCPKCSNGDTYKPIVVQEKW